MAGNWPETTWGDIAELKYGKAMTAYTDQPNVARVYGTNGPIGWHDTPLQPGPGVIVGRKGAYRGVHFANEPFWVIDTAYYLKPLVPMDLRWAYYWLRDYDVNNIDDGSPIPSTTRDAFGFTPVRLPPLGEQLKIADLLASLDAKVDLNRQMVATLEELARALFKSWFVDFDPVHAKAEGRNTGLPADIAALFPNSFDDKSLPIGWVSRPLSDIGTFLNGLALQKYPAKEGEPSLPVVKIAELRNGVSGRSGSASLSIPSEFVIDSGDHIFSWSGSLMHRIWMHGRGALNQHLFKVTPSGFPQWFVYQSVETYLPKFRAIASDKAVTMGHIQRHHLDEAMVAIPPSDSFQAFDAIMLPLHEQTLGLTAQTQKLEQLRDTLLPKLLSGKLRVADAETVTAAA